MNNDLHNAGKCVKTDDTFLVKIEKEVFLFKDRDFKLLEQGIRIKLFKMSGSLTIPGPEIGHAILMKNYNRIIFIVDKKEYSAPVSSMIALKLGHIHEVSIQLISPIKHNAISVEPEKDGSVSVDPALQRLRFRKLVQNIIADVQPEDYYEKPIEYIEPSEEDFEYNRDEIAYCDYFIDNSDRFR